MQSSGRRLALDADSEGFHKSPAAGFDEWPSLGRTQITALPRLGESPLRRLDPRAQAPVELGLGLKPKFYLKGILQLQERKDDRLATMAATPREVVGASYHFPGSSMGRGGRRLVYSLNEHFRQHDCLPQRAVQEGLDRVAREPSREPTIRSDRPLASGCLRSQSSSFFTLAPVVSMRCLAVA
jgi:hypothetical protein